jgi:hypothetical protein
MGNKVSKYPFKGIGRFINEGDITEGQLEGYQTLNGWGRKIF